MHQTKHSVQRSQKRGVPIEIIDFIYKNGDSINTHTHKKFFINKKKLESMKYKEKDFIKKNDRHILNTVIVCNGDTLITVIKPNKRIKWN